MIRYDDQHYGKGNVRVAKVKRNNEIGQDVLIEYLVNIQFYGDKFEEAYTQGTNINILPTDSIKNGIYVLAKLKPMNNPIEFALDVAEYYLERHKHIRKVDIQIEESIWTRVGTHGNGFSDKQTHSHFCKVVCERDKIDVITGIKNLFLIKTRGSKFEGFLVDEFTTLEPVKDRIMATRANVSWLYDRFFSIREIDHNKMYFNIKSILINAFITHNESQSLQHTINYIAKEILNRIREVKHVKINCPNIHYILIDLQKYGLKNTNEIYAPICEPYGNIYASVSKPDYVIEKFNQMNSNETEELLKTAINFNTLIQNLLGIRPLFCFEDLIKLSKYDKIDIQMFERYLISYFSNKIKSKL